MDKETGIVDFKGLSLRFLLPPLMPYGGVKFNDLVHLYILNKSVFQKNLANHMYPSLNVFQNVNDFSIF